MGHAPKLPAAAPPPPPPPTPANTFKPAKGASPTLGGTFLTASMPNAAPLTKPRKSLFGQ